MALFRIVVWSILAAVTTLPPGTAAGRGGAVLRRQRRQKQQQQHQHHSNKIRVPNLPLNDINVVVVTDVHSWIAGHSAKQQEHGLNADYGDVLSFYQQLQRQIQDMNKINNKSKSKNNNHQMDLWFVMNGDWIDGTGLAMNGKADYLIPLLEKMPWDAVTIGNHELYQASVIQTMFQPGGFAEWFGPKLVNANIAWNQTNTLLANRYRILKGQYSNLLVFGFLYNMQGYDPIVAVKKVEQVIQEPWFENVLSTNTNNNTDHFDAILILAHMDHHDPLVHVITKRIRQVLDDDDMPIQFVTGHTHYRGSSQPDPFSSSVEAGRYLDTVGFVSFPTHANLYRRRNEAKKQTQEQEPNDPTQRQGQQLDEQPDSRIATVRGRRLLGKANGDNVNDNNNDPIFQHVFLDAKREALAKALDWQDANVSWKTAEGVELTNFIHQVRRDLGLTQVVGCIEHDYYHKNGLYQDPSVWGLFCNDVVPQQFRERVDLPVFFVGYGTWRYDLLARELTLDEVIAVSPFNETLYQFSHVPRSVLTDLNQTLNVKESSVSNDSRRAPLFHTTDLQHQQMPSYIMCDSGLKTTHKNRDQGRNSVFDLVTTAYDKDTVHKALQKLWPKDENNGDSVPEPVAIKKKTSLSLWIDYFKNATLPCVDAGQE